MLQSFLIVRDRIPAPLAATKLSPAMEEQAEHDEGGDLPIGDGAGIERLLLQAGFRYATASEPAAYAARISHADAVILSLPMSELGKAASQLLGHKSLPLLWWCEEPDVSYDCKIDADIDAILVPGMTVAQLHCALFVATRHYLGRTQWLKEREQLLARLEERKWIDRAKGILSEIKGISEVEAYDFLRKQAMNERKRLVDVAVSIVKVYDLLREQDRGGKKR